MNIVDPIFLINRNHVLFLMTNGIHCIELRNYGKIQGRKQKIPVCLRDNLRCMCMAV